MKGLDALHAEIADFLAHLATERFTEPTRLSLLVRNVDRPDGSGDVLVTDDDFDSIRDAIDLAEKRGGE